MEAGDIYLDSHSRPIQPSSDSASCRASAPPKVLMSSGVTYLSVADGMRTGPPQSCCEISPPVPDGIHDLVV